MTEDSLGEKDKLYTNTKIIFSLKFEVFFSLFLESSVFENSFFDISSAFGHFEVVGNFDESHFVKNSEKN